MDYSKIKPKIIASIMGKNPECGRPGRFKSEKVARGEAVLSQEGAIEHDRVGRAGGSGSGNGNDNDFAAQEMPEGAEIVLPRV